MKKRKQLETLLTVIELAALAGILMLSFYLLYGYFEEGEQEVSGTAVRMTEDGQMTEEASAENSDSLEDNEELFWSTEASDVQGAETQNGSALINTVDTSAVSVRVRILDDFWSEELFDEITVSSSDAFIVERGTYTEADGFVGGSAKEGDGAGLAKESSEAGQTMESNEMDQEAQRIDADQTYMAAADDMELWDALRLYSTEGSTLTVTSLTRADGSPEYSGELYIYRLEEGLALVNELPLEEYLYAVVSSEMPSYFPEEALKAQAVCARTYALRCIEEKKNGRDTAWEETNNENVNEKDTDETDINEKNLADLNDSASFQVYNNRKSTRASVSAVDATCGKVLLADEIQYYSTSALSEHRNDLGGEEDFREFLEETPEEGAEYGSSWLRWQAELPIKRILKNLEALYAGQWEEEDIDGSALTESSVDIAVVSRSENGQVQTLAVTVGTGTIEIEGEYAVRQLLAPGDTEVVLMDGSTVSGMQLLPSAFFYVDGGDGFRRICRRG
ncbi:MAG: SpoIID/LytB domain-containing protein [Lachnospiraceae bacterium]|nr:SpoIID/LytB domain-containing protein [Lachnospiraceae bacterium]